MLKLTELKYDKVWGYELWKASTHPNGLQDDFAKFVGGDYPLLVKVIQADQQLSVQVHPDDKTAALYENCRGKTECWYVLSAEKDAKLIYGLNGVYSASELRKSIQSDSVVDVLRYVNVEAGDFIYIPAGTVHAIGGGLRLLEIQQSSDITYRLYDWGRDRECHIDKAIASIKNDSVRNVSKFQGVFSCPYFTLEEITVEGEYSVAMDKASGDVLPENYALLFVIDGDGSVNGEKASKEDCFAFAPGESIEAKGDLTLMKVIPAYQKKRA